MVFKIENNGIVFAIVLKHSFSQDGIKFLTNDDETIQLGYMKRPKNYVIDPHRHIKTKREIYDTNEVLFVKSGLVRVNFFNDDNSFINEVIIEKGDTILLCNGAHGFDFIEESELIEVKQGPYVGELDKSRFKIN
jgi:hypothetical protein